MICYDAITLNGEIRPDPLPGCLPCVCDMGGGWLWGKWVGPIWWKEGWVPERITPVYDLACQFYAKVPKGTLILANVFEEMLVNGTLDESTLGKRIGGASVVMQAARDSGFDVGHYCYPVTRYDGKTTLPQWQAVNDHLGYAMVGRRRYTSRGITTYATHITPADYSPTYDAATDTLWLAEAFRVAAGRPVVPVITTNVAVDVLASRLALWKRLGIEAVIVWSDAGVTDAAKATVQTVLGN